MRKIRIKFSSYHNVYIRRASVSGSVVEIQGQHGGIIVDRPALRRTILHGLVLLDHDNNRSGVTRFTDYSSGFENNVYTREHYREW